MSENQKPTKRQAVLAETRNRLSQLEAETHRLRAQLARLEADGLDEAAEQLERQIAELTEQESELRLHDRPAIPAADSGPARKPSAPAAASKRDHTDGSAEAAPQLDGIAGLLAGKQLGADAEQPAAIASAPVIETADNTNDERKRPLAAKLRDAPAWATSLGVHAVILVLFSLLTIVSLPEVPPPMLSGVPDGDEYLDEFSEVDFSPAEIDPTELSEMDLELSPTESTTLDQSELEAPWDSAAVGLSDLSPGVSAALPTDAASLMLGEAGGDPSATGGRGDRPDGGGKKGGAQFFGAKSKGNRFVFVVDNSGSMTQGRIETTFIELQRAIFAMSAEQSFYVIFYSDQVYSMFHPYGVDEMTPATRKNKEKLSAWLPTVEICLGGQIQKAIEKAVELDPSVVYLLSDGDMSKRAVENLTPSGGLGFVVNTFGMTVRKQESAGNLIAIARANGGIYSPVGINPVAAQMAKRRPVRKHSDGPGPVWGTKVRVRKE